MKALPFLLAFAAIPTASPRYFPYTRTIAIPPGPWPQACAVLDATLFAHANPTLADLRLYSNSLNATPSPLPYAITISESTLRPPDPARILNLGNLGNLSNPGNHAGRIAFDVEMPARSYTELTLNLSGANFTALAHVTGLKSAGDKPGTSLGTFTLFDLSAQRLSRSTTIPLQESTFPLLHIELAVTPSSGSAFVPTPAMVQGAEVPPTREAQTLYTPVAQTTQFSQRERETIAHLDLPAHIPIERISFALAPGLDGKPDKTNFSRPVKITATPHSHPESQPEFLAGEITRIHLAAPPIDDRSLSIPAILGANLESPATVELAIQNGDDLPVPLASATLEMRQRKLCFLTTPQASTVTLAYGDPTLQPPVYDLARLFDPAAPTRLATLAPEQPNPAYTLRPTPQRSFSERHPELLWLALLGVVGVLAIVAFRSRPKLGF